jgi:hypothetical protein
MIVDDFDFEGIGLSPFKADSPSLVDPDAVRSFSASSKRLQAITWRMPQVTQEPGGIDSP